MALVVHEAAEKIRSFELMDTGPQLTPALFECKQQELTGIANSCFKKPHESHTTMFGMSPCPGAVKITREIPRA